MFLYNKKEKSKIRKFVEQKLRKIFIFDVVLKILISIFLIALLVNSFRILNYLDSMNNEYDLHLINTDNIIMEEF